MVSYRGEEQQVQNAILEYQSHLAREVANLRRHTRWLTEAQAQGYEMALAQMVRVLSEASTSTTTQPE